MGIPAVGYSSELGLLVGDQLRQGAAKTGGAKVNFEADGCNTRFVYAFLNRFQNLFVLPIR